MPDHRLEVPGASLRRLAALLTAKNVLDREMAAILGRPMEKGPFGEFVAAQVFGIDLCRAANEKDYDGEFRDDFLQGKKVNIKYYARHDRNLDLKEEGGPDCYLVMTGPEKAAKARPWVIESVFVFEAAALVQELRKRNPKKKIGVAAGVPVDLWESAMIYPRPVSPLLRVTDAQWALLALFSASAVG